MKCVFPTSSISKHALPSSLHLFDITIIPWGLICTVSFVEYEVINLTRANQPQFKVESHAGWPCLFHCHRSCWTLARVDLSWMKRCLITARLRGLHYRHRIAAATKVSLRIDQGRPVALDRGSHCENNQYSEKPHQDWRYVSRIPSSFDGWWNWASATSFTSDEA